MNNLGKVYLIAIATYVVAAAATTAIEVADYKIKKHKEEKNKQKLEDEKEGVVWTIEACDVVEIYRNCEVI